MTHWFRAASQVPVAFPVLWIRRASPPAPGLAHAGCTVSAHRQARLQHPHSRDSTLGAHPPFSLVVGAVLAGLQLLLSPPRALHCCGAQVSLSTAHMQERVYCPRREKALGCTGYWAGLWTPGLRTQAGSFTGITAGVQRHGSWAVVCEGR